LFTSRYLPLCLALLLAPVALSQTNSPWIGTWTDGTVTLSITRTQVDRSYNPGQDRRWAWGSVDLGRLAREILVKQGPQGFAANGLLNSSRLDFWLTYREDLPRTQCILVLDQETDTLQLYIRGFKLREVNKTLTLHRQEE